MGAPQYEQAGADIGGTGTTNTIPRWTGPSTLGDSVITQSGSFIGIGTASPGAQLQIERAGGLSNAEYLRLRNTTSGSGSAVAQDYYVHANTVATGRIQHTWNGTTYDTTLSVWNNSLSSLQEAVRVQGGGNVGIGTASPLGYANFVALNIGDNNAAKTGLLKFRSTYNAGNGAELYQATDGRVILNADGTGTTAAILDPTNKLLNIAPASGWGLKLPATPGNADAQTLDCYQENPLATTAGNGWTPTIGGTAAQWGGTLPTVSFARYVQIGSIVFCDVRLTSASIQSTYGVTTITPPPPAQNAFATEVVVPASTTSGGVTGNGAQFGGVVYLPTLAASTAIRLTWFYFTTS